MLLKHCSKGREFGLIRYFISLLIGNFDYCHGEMPIFENGTIKIFSTPELALDWIKSNPKYKDSLYTIKSITL
jgi:hypothetical protein